MNAKSQKNPHGLTVGQKLWYVPDTNVVGKGARNFEATVIKIGLEWAILDRGAHGRESRISLNTMQVDGKKYSSPGRCYTSRESYENQLAINFGWNEIRRYVSGTFRTPDHLTLEDINTIRSILKA